MKMHILGSGEGTIRHRSFHLPLKAGPSTPPGASTRLPRNAAENKLAPDGIMSWPAFAAYAAALAGTGFLLVMALTRGIHLG